MESRPRLLGEGQVKFTWISALWISVSLFSLVTRAAAVHAQERTIVFVCVI